jgi:hypothetical protein
LQDVLLHESILVILELHFHPFGGGFGVAAAFGGIGNWPLVVDRGHALVGVAVEVVIVAA